MNNIAIKQAVDYDIPVIEGILLDTVNWLSEMGQPLWEERETKWSFLSTRYSIDEFYIALIDGKPSGCMVLTKHRPFYWMDEDTSNSLFVHKLAVVKVAKHMGVGNCLIEYAKEYASKRNISAIRLDCDEYRPKLRAFYEKHGFVCLGTRVLEQYYIEFYAYTLPDIKTGWERDNRQHFDKIVTNYDKVRWDYPNELYVDIFDYVGVNENKKALEIGAGTGKATTPFLKAGYDVTAVEIGENMAAFLIDKYKGERLNVINAAFEDVELEECSYDVIYAASAFHWVDAEIGCPKVSRLLKDGGTFALFRNNAVQADGNELYDEIQAVYDKHYYSHYKRDNRPIRISKMTYEDFLKPAEIHRGFRFESLEQYGFVDVTMKLYEATRTCGADDYIALLETMSDHIALPNDNRTALYAGIRKAISKYGGQLQMNYIFQLYMGRKAV